MLAGRHTKISVAAELHEKGMHKFQQTTEGKKKCILLYMQIIDKEYKLSPKYRESSDSQNTAPETFLRIHVVIIDVHISMAHKLQT